MIVATRLSLIFVLAALLSVGCSGYMPPLPLRPATSSPAAGPTATPEAGAPLEVRKPYYFPDRPITLLLGAERGSRADVAARLLIPRLERMLGQPVVVANRTGNDGVEAWTQLKQAKPDGHTLGLLPSPQVQVAALDPDRKAAFAMADFLPLAAQVQEPVSLFVRGTSPFRTVADLVAASRAQTEGIPVAVSATVVADLVAAADFQRKAGVKLKVTRYVDPAAVLMATLGGQAEAGIGNPARLALTARSGQGRFLAVMDEKRLKDQPDVPTLKEKGVDLVSYSNLGYAVPKGTSQDLQEYLGWALYTAASDPEHQSRMREAGLLVRYADARQYGAHLTAEGERVKQLLPMLR